MEGKEKQLRKNYEKIQISLRNGEQNEEDKKYFTNCDP